MNDNKVFLTVTDNNAVLLDDSNYINNKGANLYRPDTYLEAVEYYRLAAVYLKISVRYTLRARTTLPLSCLLLSVFTTVAISMPNA